MRRLNKVELLLATWSLLSPVLGAGVPTITLAPASSATLTRRDAPTSVPAGAIIGVPNDGIDIYLSADAQKAVNDAISAHCATPASAECQSNIAAALNNKNLQASQLQPRGAEALVAGLVVLVSLFISSVFIGKENEAVKPIPAALHIGPAQLSQASNLATATAVVVVPNGSSASTTFQLPPSPTTASAIASVSVESSTGDLHIALTAEQAAKFGSIMSLPGVCVGNSGAGNSGTSKMLLNSRAFSASTASCISADANALMYNAFSGVARMFRFINPPNPMPRFNDPAIEAELNNFIHNWEEAGPAFGVTPDRMNDIAIVVFDLAYIWDTQGVDLAIDNVIPSSSITTKKKLNCPSQEGDPKSTKLVCDKAYCQGDSRTKLCTQEPYEDCTCMIRQPIQQWEDYDLVMMRLQPNALTSWLAGPPAEVPPKSPLTCLSNTVLTSAAYISMDTAYKDYPVWCKGITAGDTYDLSNEYNKETPDHYKLQISGSMASDKWTTDLCTNSFKAIIDGCNGAADNPMYWKMGGTYEKDGLTFTVKPLSTGRPYPFPKLPTMSCASRKTTFYDVYDISGSGWASADYGKSQFFPAIAKCIGSKATEWKFDYLIAAGGFSQDGYEWKASFHTPIWTNARCFKNCKVTGNGGGPRTGDDCPGCSGDG